ncbi:unnamed protein product [Pseudo-nitzschia multistriata]|uniref:3'(2'),5'-bisphosphate nucleotidase n=1 Tax=Pseudo-nitzschia multistriata TaxID=183589 RepID=A0A448Z403_9STRA|nr:unnamed protein product [Pseudo-nitzschia multistriata]
MRMRIRRSRSSGCLRGDTRLPVVAFLVGTALAAFFRAKGSLSRSPSPSRSLLLPAAAALAFRPMPGTARSRAFRRNGTGRAEAGSESELQAQAQASSPAAWGGDLHEEAGVAAELVANALRLCLELRPRCQEFTSESKSEGAFRRDKADGTPLTALDLAIQGYVLSNLHRSFGGDSFLAEEDASLLRGAPDHKGGLSERSHGLASRLDPGLGFGEFLDAIDLGTNGVCGGGNRKGESDTNGRCWILDPIDGTKGFLKGGHYTIGLALCIDGLPVVGVLGNPCSPSIESSTMVAVKGHGLRYYRGGPCSGNNGSSSSNNSAPFSFLDLPRNLPDRWRAGYDFGGAASDPRDRSGGERDACVEDAPPYLLSLGPEPDRELQGPPPRPFGEGLPPTELCCGSLAKYFAVASGKACGFLQVPSPSSSLSVAKSWDHAPGVLCVLESGGDVRIVEGNGVGGGSLPAFCGREFPMGGGIVCVARESSPAVRERLFGSLRRGREEARGWPG